MLFPIIDAKVSNSCSGLESNLLFEFIAIDSKTLWRSHSNKKFPILFLFGSML